MQPNIETAQIERRRARNRKSYQRNKAKAKAAVVAWKLANRDKVRRYSTRYWKNNKERLGYGRLRHKAKIYAMSPREAWLVESLRSTKSRAKRKGIRFDVDTTSLKIELPSHCPILGVELLYERRGIAGPVKNSPSLDRIIPERGYVVENIRVVSHRANSLKSNASLAEMRLVLADLERLVAAGNRP
jgi:hypothetical protein